VMNLGFILGQTTHLRYILPLIIEANKRDINSVVFLYKCNKYNSPHKHMGVIKRFAKEYNFEIRNCKSIDSFDGTIFTVEGSLMDGISKSNKIVSLVCTWDFVKLYDKYIDKVDSVIFPSKFIAKRANKISDKNLYLGSPKYDIKLDREEILKKHNIKSKKNALVIYPNFPGLEARCGYKKIKMTKVYAFLRKMGYSVIVKARGKAPAKGTHQGDKYIEDASWFPHDTMELVEVADIVVIIGSAVAKECVMLSRPFIDFPIASDPVCFEYLYNYDYCRSLSPSVGFEEFSRAINELTTNDYSKEFQLARQKCLFESGNVCAKILNEVL